MPRAGDTPVRRDNTQLQRCAVVGALGAHGVSFVVKLDHQDLSILDAFDLGLDLVVVLDVREGRDVLELILLRHFGR